MSVIEIKKEANERMLKSIQTLKSELSKLRTGRAHPSLLDAIKVSYYGIDTPLSQIASINVEGPQTLTVAPFEKQMITEIDKAIRQSDLGLNPVVAGSVARIPLPALTEERRKQLTKVVKDEGEQAKVAIRNIRRDANAMIKDLLKDKQISEDESHHAEGDMQKMTDKCIKDIDDILKTKEQELMEV